MAAYGQKEQQQEHRVIAAGPTDEHADLKGSDQGVAGPGRGGKQSNGDQGKENDKQFAKDPKITNEQMKSEAKEQDLHSGSPKSLARGECIYAADA